MSQFSFALPTATRLAQVLSPWGLASLLLFTLTPQAHADIFSDSDEVLGAAQSILEGGNINQIISGLGPVGSPLRTKYENALWELYKADRGVEIVNGVETRNRTGVKRRLSLRNAALALKDLTWVQYRHKRAAHDELEAGFETVLQETLAQDGINNGRAVLSLAGSYNPIYNFLPESVPGVPNVFIPSENRDTAAKAALTIIDTDTRAKAVRTIFQDLPVEHRRSIYPIIMMDKKPRNPAQGGGGTWPSSQVEYFKGSTAELNTKIKFAHIDLLIMKNAAGQYVEGIVGLPMNRMAMTQDDSGRKSWGFTVYHESGHSVDFTITIKTSDNQFTEGVAGDVLPGITYNSEANPNSQERVAEAYARYFLKRSEICKAPAPLTLAECNKKAVTFLANSKAGKIRPIKDANQNPILDENGDPVKPIFK